jgi:hypothetical protein
VEPFAQTVFYDQMMETKDTLEGFAILFSGLRDVHPQKTVFVCEGGPDLFLVETAAQIAALCQMIGCESHSSPPLVTFCSVLLSCELYLSPQGHIKHADHGDAALNMVTSGESSRVV